jgi:iron complex outermembrane receptor protein
MKSSRSYALLLLFAPRVAFAAEPDEPQAIEVEVRGKPLPPTEARKDPSVAGSTRARDALEAPGLTAPDALRTMVGVTVTETGGLGAASTAQIRGATAAQTPVYLAGVRINDDVGGAADLSSVPLFLIDRVEVYRGNAPLEADRLGIGGAIFFEPVRVREPRVAVGGLAGSFGSRGAYAYSAAASQRSRLLFGARVETADNDYEFWDDNGTLADESDDRPRRLQNADATLIDLWALGRTSVGLGV